MSAPVVHHQQNRCMRRFHDAGAVSPATAATLDQVGVRDSMVFRYLRSRGVIVDAAGGRFYLDPDAERTLLGAYHLGNRHEATNDGRASSGPIVTAGSARDNAASRSGKDDGLFEDDKCRQILEKGDVLPDGRLPMGIDGRQRRGQPVE